MQNRALSDAPDEFLRKQLLRWGSSHRRSYPWREDPTPYRVLIAEICLRKTGAKLATPVFLSIVRDYPAPSDLAHASREDLVSRFERIGLASRGRQLIEIAKRLILLHGGRVPSTYDDLISLPGVGRYIANAVLCFAYKQSVPIVDQSIIRLLSRFYGIQQPEMSSSSEAGRTCWHIVERLLPRTNSDRFNYALLDLAAGFCRPHKPHCTECALNARCAWPGVTTKAESSNSQNEDTE